MIMKFVSNITDKELHIIIQDESITNTLRTVDIIKHVTEFKRPVIRIDLCNVKYASSVLVNALVAIRNITKSKIFIHNVNEDVLMLIEIVGLQNIFQIVNDYEHTNQPKSMYTIS